MLRRRGRGAGHIGSVGERVEHIVDEDGRVCRRHQWATGQRKEQKVSESGERTFFQKIGNLVLAQLAHVLDIAVMP